MSSASSADGDSTIKWPTKVQLLVDAGGLREQKFRKPEVAALWQKAVDTTPVTPPRSRFSQRTG